MSAEANKERARDLLASVQKVLEWKAWITKARKALDNERTTDGELMNLDQQLRSYRKNQMEKLIAFVIGFVVVVVIILGCMWGAWSLWCWVLPQIWADGPKILISPDFMLFFGSWFLLGIIGRSIFGIQK